MARQRETEGRAPVRWDPFRELMLEGWSPSREFNLGSSPLARVMEDFFGERGRAPRAPVPPIDIVEAGDHYRITAEVPGLRKEDLTVEIEDGVLVLRGEKKSEREEEEGKARWLERSYGAFQRSFAIPADANAQELEAEYADGVLKITIPKRPEAKPRTVAIKG